MFEYSVVIPIRNEEASLKPLFFSLKKALDNLSKHYEIIFVNDDSDDKSLEVLRNINSANSNLVILTLDKHHGQSTAMQAGFDFSRGRVIITIDADLQYDPRDIPRLIERLEEGFDVVCSCRKERDDNLIKKISSRIAFIARKTITKEKRDLGGTLMVIKREVLPHIFLSGGMHRFLSSSLVKLGYKVGEVEVKVHRRRFGRSKYNIHNRLFQGLEDLLNFHFRDIHDLMKRQETYKIKEVITL